MELLNRGGGGGWTMQRRTCGPQTETTHGGEMKHTQTQATSHRSRTHTHTHMQDLTLTLQKQTGTHLPLSPPPHPSWEEQYKQLKWLWDRIEKANAWHWFRETKTTKHLFGMFNAKKGGIITGYNAQIQKQREKKQKEENRGDVLGCMETLQHSKYASHQEPVKLLWI